MPQPQAVSPHIQRLLDRVATAAGLNQQQHQQQSHSSASSSAGIAWTESEVAALLSARGVDMAAVVAAADALRAAVCGDSVSYVVNRNINYTNGEPGTAWPGLLVSRGPSRVAHSTLCVLPCDTHSVHLCVPLLRIQQGELSRGSVFSFACQHHQQLSLARATPRLDPAVHTCTCLPSSIRARPARRCVAPRTCCHSQR
jgi:hypothetical protein